MHSRKSGDKLYLTLQLSDRNTTRRVFVELMDDTDAIIVPLFEIPHITNGIYRESTQVMPNTEVISAFYYVYEPDGVTLDTSYTAAEDRFMLEAEIVIPNNNMVAEMVGEVDMEATVDETDLSAIIDGEVEVTALLSEDEINIIGEVLDE